MSIATGSSRLLIRPYVGLPFSIQGFVEDRPVAAETVEDLLVVDEALYERARQLAVDGARFELPDDHLTVPATVAGDDVAVALTLLRSLDRLVSMRISFALR